MAVCKMLTGGTTGGGGATGCEVVTGNWPKNNSTMTVSVSHKPSQIALTLQSNGAYMYIYNEADSKLECYYNGTRTSASDVTLTDVTISDTTILWTGNLSGYASTVYVVSFYNA